MRRYITLGALLLVSMPVLSKPPQEVFAIASKSVVVVRAFDQDMNLKATGSGVVVSKGEIVTNCHVVQEGSWYSVGRDKAFKPATVLYADIAHDLCLLVSPELSAPPVQIGAASRLKIGAPVYAVGAPQGLELSLSDGLVSQLRGDKSEPLIQTTAPISPGSSGGGLFDSEGRLVGITTLYLKESQNLNFAVPVEWLKQLRTQKNLSLTGFPPSSKTDVPAAPAAETLPEWMLVGEAGTFNTYLKTDSVRQVGNGLVQVWVVMDFMKARKSLDTQYS